MEKSGWGNNIYLFLKIKFLLSVNLLKTSSTHTDSIEALLKNFWLAESKLIPCYTVKSYTIETVHYRG